ncbi:FAD-dependent oxidoreductase (plasmid) [Streptomyces sp. CA-142005]|uniref:FAD-dependent oxidoreductase n=1 Tax=Streptomyces sp. CA-142005 TaxID=3240052 RepID=UPI003D8A955E
MQGRLLVVGGGPAGVAAATAAAQAGFRVLLAERGCRLGGQLSVAGRAFSRRALWLRWSSWAEAELKARSVEVRLNTAVTAEDCAAWERVVLATGARSAGLSVRSPGRIAVLSAWEAILRPTPLTGSIVVFDGDGEWPALDAAELLATHGLAVYLVTPAETPGHGLRKGERGAYLDRLDALSVRLMPRHDLALCPDGHPAQLRDLAAGRVRPFPLNLGAIVVAAGRISEDHLAAQLRVHPKIRRVGDAVQPRCLEDAITEGTRVVESLRDASSDLS